ncbi:serine dehydratase subunit alpha family protein [Acetomicrobium sp. UBA5826]|uniref:L-cysteine desulfidase family protein n=1 Tax=Acetomicrobium sp. UBA5826 TaxID=1946039 RepID=UPI00257B5782|nr:L-serine ammonia-lyase, iron-sulfur-dependent, subunit alpha [Acetomicrobium sp. UBA5826]
MTCGKIPLKQFLKEEVKPAFGCTEPVAVALAVVRAREELPVPPERVNVVISSNIFKNGASVGIPGTEGLKGNKIAAALGLVTGKSDDGLEVLKDCDPDSVLAAMSFLKSGSVSITVDKDVSGVFAKATVSGANHSATCIIEKSHDNITEVFFDGKTIFKGSNVNGKGNGGKSVAEEMSSMTWDEVMEWLKEVDEEDIAFLLKGKSMNMEIAEKGFESNVGLGVGRAIRNSFGNSNNADIGLLIKAWSAAAADARMSGVAMPVMSSAGSGNHGITAIIPVAIYGHLNNIDEGTIAKGLLVSHLVTSYIKSRTGRLSTTCGCAFAAGSGAAAGITWLRTKDLCKAKTAVNIVISNLIGMLCDGAKGSCAFKVGTGAIEAYHAAMIASEGVKLDPQGVIGKTVEQTVNNAAEVASCMGEIGRTLLEIIAKE